MKKKNLQEKRQNKKEWYKIGKVIIRGHQISLHKESKLAAKRTYMYYKVNKGNWEGPTPREFSKMRKSRYNELFADRVTSDDNDNEENSGEFSFTGGEGLLGSNTFQPSHVTTNHMTTSIGQ